MKFKNNFNNNITYLIYSFLIFISFIDIYQSKVLIIPFKSFFPKVDYSPNVSKGLMTSWLKKKLYLEIENESGQKIPMILNTEEPQMHTRDVVALIRTDERYYEPYNKNISDFCNFNYQKSKTYQCITEYNHTFYSISNTCYAKEKMYFYNDLNLKEKKSYEIQFLHSSNETHICFFSALQLTDSPIDKKINLFSQLKHLINSKTYSWSLKFNSPDEGYLIFGDIIDNNELKFYNDNKDENYMSFNVPTFLFSNIIWKLYFEKIYFDNYVIQGNPQLYFFLDIQTRYITVPKEYFYEIKKRYLLTNENISSSDPKFICFDEESEFYFHSVYCNKKEYLALSDNYKKLPTLNLYGFKLGTNITFTPKELFLEKDDKLYFFIAYDSHKDDEWHLGNIFLQKYITVFDNDAKKISILKQSDKNINDEDKDNTTLKIVIIVFLVFILSGLIFGFLGIFYGKRYYQSRKKKANELSLMIQSCLLF